MYKYIILLLLLVSCITRNVGTVYIAPGDPQPKQTSESNERRPDADVPGLGSDEGNSPGVLSGKELT